MKPQQIALAEMVTQFYLASGDFNGLGIHALKSINADVSDVIALIELREIDLVRGDLHPTHTLKLSMLNLQNNRFQRFTEKDLPVAYILRQSPSLDVTLIRAAWAHIQQH